MMLNIGAAFSMAGVATKDIAAWFAVDTYVIGYVFTLFSIGYSLAILGNGFLLERVDIRLETAVAAGASVLAAAVATFVPALEVFAAAVFFYGMGLGVLCSVAYYTVVQLYDEAARPAKLNVLNFFFSFGAIITPVLAGQALAHGAAWQWLYQAALPLYLAAGVWAFSLSFDIKPAARQAAGTGDDRWGPAVYILGSALLCYVISEMIFCYWVVMYMMERLELDVALASMALSVFWLLMAAGRLTAGRLIARAGIRRYLVGWGTAAFVAFAGLLLLHGQWWALALVALMGFAYSGLFATTMAYGTMQLSHPSPRLTTFFLVIGAVGGVLSFLLSSWLKQNFGVTVTMGFAAAVIGLYTVLVAIATRRT